MKITKRTRYVIGIVVGMAAAAAVGVTVGWKFAPLAGWDAFALVILGLFWYDFHGRNQAYTERIAKRDDMGHTWVDATVLLASLASIGSVAVLTAQKDSNLAVVGFGVFSIVLSWALIHSLYSLRYAVMYYAEGKGVDFEGGKKPTFSDFQYLAFTIGMTYQVSDTTLQSEKFRKVALRHALLSFVFGTAIIATTINFVASLSQ